MIRPSLISLICRVKQNREEEHNQGIVGQVPDLPSCPLQTFIHVAIADRPSASSPK